MGLYAGYYAVKKQEADKRKLEAMGEEEVLESLEVLDGEVSYGLDLDKMWDVMHFVFTGIDSSNPIEGNPLSEAVVGKETLDIADTFIAITPNERIGAIVEALEAFDMEEAMQRFDMKACGEAELYPNIWDYEEEKEDIIEELMEHFENMKTFYRDVADKGLWVIVSIS